MSTFSISLRRRCRSLSRQPLRHPDPAALRHVDQIAARDRELHGGLAPSSSDLDDLDDDLLARLDQLVDAPAAASASLGYGLTAWEHDLVDVQEAVSLEADVDESGLHTGQDVVDLALVDVADDRAAATPLDVELGDLPLVARGCLLVLLGRRPLRLESRPGSRPGPR